MAWFRGPNEQHLAPMSVESAQEQLDLAAQLMGDLTPEAFSRAVVLIERAAEKGHAAAICQLATIEAVGAGRARDLEKALDLLRVAAGLGSDHALKQLTLLGCNRTTDTTELLQVPKSRQIADSPRIRVIEQFAPAAICDWIVEQSRNKLTPAMVWDARSGGGRVDAVRTNDMIELRLSDMDVVLAVQRARISVAMRLPESIFETPQVMRYTVGQEFKLHHDYLDPRLPGHAVDLDRRGQRIATFLIYLNDDFQGGETIFPRAGVSFRGTKGDALYFANVSRSGAPDPNSMHAGKSPTAGEKWLFSQWIRDHAPEMSKASS
jgi:prolyl 4-hydroxylase